MKLKRLIIHGFKSFKDKTIIHFDDGITGIVGPNGCGKSNIVDALFWVMGEQSAKHLRGTKMQDLIFSGSSKYNPSTWAEVSLVLSNEDGKHIHIGQKLVKPSEIQITRKLYKNGETEYRINNFPCRLKDIHEVFMDTGAGAKSYSIIAQGEINRLVQAKPVERRAMIEDVAGITKFKVRRKESVKKIENTQLNLDRLNDLQVEIHKQLKKLESQAEKAQRAKNLREKYERHELIVTSHKEYDLLTSFRDLKSGAMNALEELDELKITKNTVELSLEDERLKKEELVDQLNDLQASFNEKSKDLAASEERLSFSQKNKLEKEAQQLRLEEELVESKEYLETRKSRVMEVEDELQSLQSESTDGIDIEELQSSLENLQETRDNSQEKVQELTRELSILQDDLALVYREVATVEAQSHEYSSSLENLAIEVEELEKETSSHLDSISGERESLHTITSERDNAKVKMTTLQEDLAQTKSLASELESDVRAISTNHIQTKAEWELLKSVNSNLTGNSEGYKKFFQTFDNGEAKRLGELIKTSGEYGTCVDSLLGEWLDLVLHNDTDEVNSWLTNNAETRIDIIKDSIPLASSSETVTRLETLGATSVKPMVELVNIEDNEWKQTLLDFLDGFYVVENLDQGLMEDMSSSINFKGLVSLDGQYVLVKSHGLVVKKFKGNQENKVGFVQRNNQIKSLSEKVEVLSIELAEKEPKLVEIQELKRTTEVELESARDNYNQLNSQYHAAKSAFEAKENFAGNNSNKLSRLIEKKSQVSIKRLELVEKEETLTLQKERFDEQSKELSSQLEDEKEQLETVNSSFQSKREEFVSLKVQMDSFEGRKKNIENTVRDLQGEIDRHSDKIEKSTERKGLLADEYTSLIETIDELEATNVEKAEQLANEESNLLGLKDQVDVVIVGMQDREDEVKKSTTRINSLEKEVVVAQTRVEQIIIEEEVLVRDIFERYQVDLRDVISNNIELDSAVREELLDITSIFLMESEDGEVAIEKEAYEFEKRFPGQVKESREKFRRYKSDLSRLGEINWQAVDDYDRQKIRHGFLKKQEEELNASLDDLQAAIDHIDQKSKVRFKEAFDEVNMRFVKVFPIIFGGGSATLKLVGSADDPDSGIDIIAQPPGKKMQNINLMSGGEKAMTAVSLIFSIFLVKPSPFCLLDEVDAPLDDANVGRFNELLREMSSESQFILITHNKKTMELNDVLYGVTMQEPGISKAISVQVQ